MYKGSMQKRYIDNYKDQASKLEMENYLSSVVIVAWKFKNE